MKFDAENAVLKKLGLDYELLDSGCCGMAGSFGFEAGHYDISVAVGERVLLPAVRQADEDTLIIADGFSCREQIAGLTGRGALHLAQVLQMAMHEGPDGPAGAFPEMRYQPLGKWEPAPSPALAAAVAGRGRAGRRRAWSGPWTRNRGVRRPRSIPRTRARYRRQRWPSKSAKAAEPDTRPQESKLHVIDGVQVYARKDERGKPSKLDAIDQDEPKIRDIADRLFRRGFGVMRQRSRGPARSFTCSRRPGPGRRAPDDPFDRGDRRTRRRQIRDKPQPGDIHEIEADPRARRREDVRPDLRNRRRGDGGPGRVRQGAASSAPPSSPRSGRSAT